MQYTIVASTNRPGSNSLKVGKYYQEVFKKEGINAEILSLTELPEDFVFSNMFDRKNPSFESTQDLVSKTDKFLFVIPEYNGSFPGVLKAFIDACKFPDSFANKKCALVGLSSGKFGNLRGLEHFSGVANYVKMDVYFNKMYLPGIDADLSDDGEINTPQHVQLIEKQVKGFIDF